MRIALFGKEIADEAWPYLGLLQELAHYKGHEVFIFEGLLGENPPADLGNWREGPSFRDHASLRDLRPDFLFSIGGDGTILHAATLIRDSQIPILGINTGRLGFLANVNKEALKAAIRALEGGHYRLSSRSLLQMHCEALKLEWPMALNEVTVSRKDTTSMVTVETWINDQFLNNYWSDGLIVATPTGSTGYSLSCNGPIIMPGTSSLVITPIAPHNLNVRPFVIPDTYPIRLVVQSREKQFLVSLDSRIYAVPTGTEVQIKKADHQLNLVEIDKQNFPGILRNKLLWGYDKRN